MTEQEMWLAVKNNDENFDGVFYYAVKTTNIFCKPSCKSKLPKRENVVFFKSKTQALEAGYRPCRRCRSDIDVYEPIKSIAEEARKIVEDTFLRKKQFYTRLSEIGVSSHRVSEIFKQEYGVTPVEYANQLKLKEIKYRLINSDDRVIDIAYSVGFNSLSAFYRFFKERTGTAPSEFRKNRKK